MHLVKAWTAVDKLSLIWKSDLLDEIKQDFFKAVIVSTTIWIHHLDTDKIHEEKAKWELHKNATCCFGQILEAEPNKIEAVCLLVSHLTNHPSKMNKT